MRQEIRLRFATEFLLIVLCVVGILEA